MGKLEGKVALITGAARGIGAAAARLFVNEGARVMLINVLAEPLQALAQELGEGVREIGSTSDFLACLPPLRLPPLRRSRLAARSAPQTRCAALM